MGMLARHLAFLYRKTPLTQPMTYAGVDVYGYFDQEENLNADLSGDQLLVRRTVFRIPTPPANSPLSTLRADSAVTIHDPETGTDAEYRVSDTELVGDGREMRLILAVQT